MTEAANPTKEEFFERVSTLAQQINDLAMEGNDPYVAWLALTESLGFHTAIMSDIEEVCLNSKLLDTFDNLRESAHISAEVMAEIDAEESTPQPEAPKPAALMPSFVKI